MAVKKWVLTDTATGTFVSDLVLRAEQVGGAFGGCSVLKRRLNGGLSDGVDVVTIDNGRLQFEVVPTRGMSLRKAWIDGQEIGWRSPVRGPVHPQFVPLVEPSGLGWLDGFDELLVRCGLESNGAPEFDEQGRLKYPLHGRIANKPANRVDVTFDEESGEIKLMGVVEEVRFHFLKLRMTSTFATNVGESSIRIHDEIANLSASPAEFQMLYHVNFGSPLLDDGSQVVLPAKSIVPRNEHAAGNLKHWASYGPATAGFEEQVYFFELLCKDDGATQTLLKNADGSRGVSLHFDKRRLPYFSLWKNTTSLADGYVTGLEPGTNFPNPRSYEGEQGRVVKLPPGGKFAFGLQMEMHRSAEEVQAAEQAIAAIQGDVKPTIFDQPQPGWCA